jgi:hypothetical protein
MLSLRHLLTKANHWCTGEDSNLRTSLGGTDLQSVGFNHSPTCAKTLRANAADHASSGGPRLKFAGTHAKPADTTQHKSHFNFAKLTFAIQGNQGRAQDTAKITTRRKSSEWSAFWKNLLRRYYGVRRLPDNSFLLLLCSLSSSFSGAGEGNRTPDPLITNQMLYRLSYASNWGKARLRASLSHGSLPDVRDNYIKYHRAKLGCNNGRTDPGPVMLSFQP